MVVVFLGCCGLFWWLWVDFDWGVVVDIGGLGGSNYGIGFGFFGFIWRCVWMLLSAFCIWVCFELCLF